MIKLFLLFALSICIVSGYSISACPKGCSLEKNVPCNTNRVTLTIPDICSGKDCEYRRMNLENKDIGGVDPSKDLDVSCSLHEYRMKILNIMTGECVLACYKLSKTTSSEQNNALTNKTVPRLGIKLTSVELVIAVIAAIIVHFS